MPRITLTRLTNVPESAITAHMSDPRVARHMPLMPPSWSAEATRALIAAKEACWARDGLGHWAFEADGKYAGWGGFQKEGTEWDFGLVLRPECFGTGGRIAHTALDFARADPRIPYVTFLLPPSRRHLGALSRMGARQTGTTLHEGQSFLKFRLETPG